MDPLTLLRDVSAAYRSLKSLAIEVAIVTESGDENSNQRSENRMRFFYAAPGRVRSEPCGKDGNVTVVDGEQMHTIFGNHRMGGGPRYGSVPVAQMHRLPHLFWPEFPFPNDHAFLFAGIEERAVEAEILRYEDGCHVISVKYEAHPGIVINGSSILFWVNAENHMVMRQQGDVGHRFPAEDDVTWTRHTVAVRQIRVDEPLPHDTFHFTPPATASLLAGGRGLFSTGGSGFVDDSADEKLRLEHHGSHEWEGGTLVERSKWKIRGITITFERRLTFSGDEKELHVAERIAGPKGHANNEYNLPVG